MKDTTLGGLVRDARTPLIGREAEMDALLAAFEAVMKRGETRIVTLVGPGGIGKSRLIQDFVLRMKADASIRGLEATPKGAPPKRASQPPPGEAQKPKTGAPKKTEAPKNEAPESQKPEAEAEPSKPKPRPQIRIFRGSARDSAAAFGIFARLLRARFGIIEGMDRDILRTQVRTQVTRVIGDRKVGDVVYFLGQFLGLPFEESPLTKAVRDDPRQVKDLRNAIFKTFLEADAADGPLCLIFEDLHAAHEDSLDLLRYLLEYLTGPILILCAGRPELLLRYEDWARAGERRHKLIELPALADEDAAALMEALLAPAAAPGGKIPHQLVEAACNFAGGNPQLLEQMLRIYKESGVLEEEDDFSDEPKFRVNLKKLSTARLPITVEDAVNARLSALEPDEKQFLEQAATMGSVFWSGAFVVLGRMGRQAPALWDEGRDAERRRIARMLENLIDRDYILKVPDSTFPASDEYVFKHNKEREAIQRRTPSVMVRRYHQLIADWMDSQDDVHNSEEYLSILAGHRERARDDVLSGLAYLEAGDVARSRYANSKAVDHYQRGLVLLGDSHCARRIDALHNFGDSLALLGRIDDALAAFREMLTLAYRLDLRRKGGAAHNRLGRLSRDMGLLDEAASHLSMAMTLFQETGDERGVASSYDDIGKLYWLRGEYDQALSHLREGLTRRRRLADRRSIALSLNNVGLVLQDSGEFKQALESFEQSLLIRREIGDLIGIVQSLNNLGAVAQAQGDFERALRLFQEALEIAQQMGERNRIALVLANIGETHYLMNKADLAIEILKQAEELCDALGDNLGLAETLRGLGDAYLLQGDLAKARSCISRAVDLFAAVRSKAHLGIALRTLGEITASGGWGSAHTKSAREYFVRSAAIFEQTHNEAELARTFRSFAHFLRTEPDLASDEASHREADAMTERANAIFARLKISTMGMDGAPFFGGRALPARPAPT
ncbi:MAG: tetratricopeptide repeat protein [Polyangiaceae bacterium]|nr:tetratricopeptide repeat protein [Polyangiaceae bacterium]NUQ75357.1 tetratricopeptide repeat protein [Polyangiaceae bacterium]